MPYKNKEDRNIAKEYANYGSTEEAKNKRVENNKARRMMVRRGKVRKNDGQDVDHVVPLSKGGKTTAANLRVLSAHNNRSFDRNADHSIKSNK